MADRYTPSDLCDLVRQTADEPHFRERNDEWGANRKLVFGQRKPEIPGLEQLVVPYTTPELLDGADKYTARFLNARMTVNISAQGEGPRAFERAQVMENFSYRLLRRWRAEGRMHGPIHDMSGVTGEGWWHLRLNHAVMPIIPVKGDEDDEAYLTHNAEIWKEFEQGERSDLFELEPISLPETIYYSTDKSVIFSRSRVPLDPLQRMYLKPKNRNLWDEAGRGKRIGKDQGRYEITTLTGGEDEERTQNLYNETVLLYVIDTSEFTYHIIEDDVAGDGKASKMHTIGCYKNIFGTPCFFPVRARVTNHPSSQFAAHPLTYAAMQVAPYVNILGTVIHTGGVRAEQMRYQMEALQGAEAALERQPGQDMNPELFKGGLWKAANGYRLTETNSGVSAATLKAWEVAQQDLLRYSYPPALGQPQESGATSGHQQTKMQDVVADVLDPPLEGIAAAQVNILHAVFNGAVTLEKDLTFRNFSPTQEMGAPTREVMQDLTLKWEDINPDVDIGISYDSMSQYSRMALVGEGVKLLQPQPNGVRLLSYDTFYRDYMGVDDPQALKRRIFIEDCVTIAEDAAKKTVVGLVQQVTAPVGMEAMAETGIQQPPPPGGPPMGGGMDPGMVGEPTIANAPGQPMPMQPTPPAQDELGRQAGVEGVSVIA